MKFKFEVKDLFKLPNILCYIRIALVPLFVYLYFTAEEPVDYYVCDTCCNAFGDNRFS